MVRLQRLRLAAAFRGADPVQGRTDVDALLEALLREALVTRRD
jgi:hypothetical protein